MTMTARILIKAMLLVGLGAACGDDEYGARSCMGDVRLTAEVEPDNRELGFTALEAVAFLGPSTGQLTWHDGAMTEIDVRFSRSGTVRIDRYPPRQGYCYPSMRIAGELQLGTSDGRLQERLPAKLIAMRGPGGQLDAVFPMFDGPIEPASNGLIPADWRTPGNTERLDVQIDAPGNRKSAFCGLDERPVSDPLERCTDRPGVLRFVSYPPDTFADHHNIDVSKIRKWLVASWRWLPR
jgi:hypothetical protein